MNAFCPSLTKQVGDFGTININMGDFVVDGNVYSHVDIAKVADQHSPVPTPEVDHYETPSFEVLELEVKADDRA